MPTNAKAGSVPQGLGPKGPWEHSPGFSLGLYTYETALKLKGRQNIVLRHAAGFCCPFSFRAGRHK